MRACRARPLAALLIVFCMARAAHAADPLAPRAELGPRDVVAAQLAALRENTPDGIARVFGFASPANRAATGPVSRFGLMLREAYPELLGHRSAAFGELLIDGDEAAQAVDILDAEGQRHHYVFLLSRQRGEICPGCWMTDGVVNAPAAAGRAI